MNKIMSLAALRMSLNKTQEQVAGIMKITQGGVYRIEKRPCLRLSTIRRYLQALGAEMELKVKFPDGSEYLLKVGSK